MHPESSKHQPSEARLGDSPVGNRRLRNSLEVVFRDVQLQTADAPPHEQRDLRVALRQICIDARRAGLRAEQLLIMIKDVWSALPAGISRVQALHGDERLNYVITTCVDEYYGEDNATEQYGERGAT